MRKTGLLLVFMILLAGCSAVGEKVEAGDIVTVNYVGKFEDGRVFDTSLREVAENPVIKKTSTFSPKMAYNPIKFQVGAGEVISGFDEGVIGMKEGETREITIPPEKGYGNWSPERTQLYPRIQTLDVVEEVPMEELANMTGTTQFVKNAMIPWRYWQARIMAITPDTVILKSEVNDTSVNTPLGTLEIEVDTGTITMTFTPIQGATIDTMENPFGPWPPRFGQINETNFVIDFNHPLAGKTLIFEVTVESIEKAGS